METRALLFGLLYDQNAASLAKSVINVNVLDTVAEIGIKYLYEAIAKNHIDCSFKFPIDETTSALTHFELEVDGSTMVAVVKDKNAQNNNENSSSTFQKNDTKKDVISISLGQLPINKPIKILVKIVTHLPSDSNLDIKASIPSILFGSAGNVQLSARCQSTFAIGSIICSPPQMKQTQLDVDEFSATATFQKEGRDPLPCDISLSVKLKEPTVAQQAGLCSSALIEETENSYAMAISLRYNNSPGQNLEKIQEAVTEVIFLLDQSGSMAGSKIRALRESMETFLSYLNPKTKFNGNLMAFFSNNSVIGFGSSFKALFSHSCAGSTDNVFQAQQHVSRLEASMGGTNLFDPLSSILSDANRTTPLQLMILTDGIVEREDQVQELIRKHASKVRIFSFGIGADVNKEFIKGMAAVTRGRAEFVGNQQQLQKLVDHYLKKALHPAISSISIDYGSDYNHKITQAPQQIHPVFDGECLVVYAFLPKQKDENSTKTPREIAIQGLTHTGPVTLKIPFLDTLSGQKTNSLIHRLYARSVIRDLEDKNSPYHDLSTGKLKPGISQEFVNNEIISLSTTWNIISSLTTLSCVEQAELRPTVIHPSHQSNINTNVVEQNVPLAQQPVNNNNRDRERDRDRDRFMDRRSWHVAYKPNYRDRSRSRSRSRSNSPTGSKRSWKPRERSRSPVKWNSNNTKRRSTSPYRSASSPFKKERNRTRSRSPPKQKSDDVDFYKIISLQQRKGTWIVSQDLASAMHSSVSALHSHINAVIQNSIKAFHVKPSKIEKALCTIMVIGFITQKYPQLNHIWKPLIKNSHQYIQKILQDYSANHLMAEFQSKFK